jgi:hypothetical protein
MLVYKALLFMLVPASKSCLSGACLVAPPIHILQLPSTGHTSCLILDHSDRKGAIVEDLMPNVEMVGCE